MSDSSTKNSTHMPRGELVPDGVTSLIDEWIKEGWIAPENRLEEIAVMYKKQRDANWRQLLKEREWQREEREAYGYYAPKL